MSLGLVGKFSTVITTVMIVVLTLFIGDVFHDPLLLLPEVPDKENLQHVYDVVSDGTAVWHIID